MEREPWPRRALRLQTQQASIAALVRLGELPVEVLDRWECERTDEELVLLTRLVPRGE